MALSLYNKYRPQTFDDVVGQHHVERTLANAVEKNTVSHAYLFCGPRGTGKTTTARILAKALLCDKAPTASPDGSCEACKQISEGIHSDVYELDAASRTGVDNVREEIIGRVNFAPTHGKHKIYIIDEVHMLSQPAFNALLKTLEEPPSHVVFVLCTTDVHKVPDTVQARCQRFDFKRLSASEIVGRLQYICEREGFDNEPAALELIAQRSQGGMRDAIRSLEQVAVFSGGKVSYSAAESLLGMVDAEQLFALCDELAKGDAAACFNWVAAYVQSGSDIAILVNDLAGHIRNLYAVSVSGAHDEHLIAALEIDALALPRLREQAALFSTPERLAWMLTVLGKLSAELKNAANARLALEVALTRILRPESTSSLEALTARVAELEARLALLSSGEPARVTSAQAIGASAAAPVAVAPAVSAAVASATTTAASAASATAPVTDSSRPAELNADSTAAPFDSVESAGSPERGTASAVAAAEVLDAQASSAQAPGSDSNQANVGAASVEPSAAQQASPPAAQQEGTDDQALFRKWDNVVDNIKKQKRGVAASLGGITPSLSKDGNHLILELPAQASTSRQYLETDANKTLLRDTVAKVFGKPLSVELRVATEPQAAEVSEPFASAAGAESEAVASSSFSAEPAPARAAEAVTTDAVEAVSAVEASSAPSANEPSKEELDAILSASLNTEIRFEEQ